MSFTCFDSLSEGTVAGATGLPSATSISPNFSGTFSSTTLPDSHRASGAPAVPVSLIPVTKPHQARESSRFAGDAHHPNPVVLRMCQLVQFEYVVAH